MKTALITLAVVLATLDTAVAAEKVGVPFQVLPPDERPCGFVNFVDDPTKWYAIPMGSTFSYDYATMVGAASGRTKLRLLLTGNIAFGCQHTGPGITDPDYLEFRGPMIQTQ